MKYTALKNVIKKITTVNEVTPGIYMEILQNNSSYNTKLKKCSLFYNIISFPMTYEKTLENSENVNQEHESLFGTMWIQGCFLSEMFTRFTKEQYFSLSDMGIMNENQQPYNNHITYKIDIDEVDVFEFRKLVGELTISDFKSLTLKEKIMEKDELKFLFRKWCDKFDKCKNEPMSDGLSSVFMKLVMLEMGNDSIPPELKTQFIYNVIEKRAEYIELKINDHVKAFLTYLVNNPGAAVMYLYYMKSAAPPNINISMHELSKIFPMGFPSDSELSELWEAQKIKGNNMLDMVDVS
jgi:hypothetical protein